METQQKLKEAFGRYLENRYTAEDFRLIQHHFQQETERDALCSLIEDELNRAPASDDKRVDRILDNTDVYISNELKKRKAVQNVPLYRKLYFRIAAAAVLIIGVGIVFTLRQPVKAQLLTVKVPYGKMMQITLPDSSRVYLNAGTTLQYPQKFTGATRAIRLKDGQAYFEIVHNAAKPFVVNARGLNVTVLGTSFEVTAFEREKEASVNVNSGKVGLQSPQQIPVFLLAGEKAIIDQTSHHVYKTISNKDDIAAWRTKQLIFENEPLLSVLQTLERTYNVHFEIRNQRLIRERITTRFKNQTLDNVLTALSFSNHFTYTKANDQIIIVN